jgi:hypothetical protein
LPPTPNRLAHTPLSPSLVDSDNSLARKKARLTRGESDAVDTSDDSAAAAPKQPRKVKKRAAIPLEPTDHDDEQRADGNVDRYAETQIVQQPPIAPVGAPNTKSTVFALLPLMLASNANNPYAPTDPRVRQHYLNEIQQRQLHPLRTLPDCTNSAVKACVRGGLFERFFCGFSISECVNTYNSLGGAANANNSAKAETAVSKAVLKDAAKWFNEENVVVPWAAMRDPDKKCLERFGLGKQHFPYSPRDEDRHWRSCCTCTAEARYGADDCTPFGRYSPPSSRARRRARRSGTFQGTKCRPGRWVLN